MRRDDSIEISVRGRVVHVVGLLTEQVCSFLEPAALAVARSGRKQSVVMIDSMRYRGNLARLHDSVELVLVPSEANPFRQWRALRTACRGVLSRGDPLHAVHLHGLLPALAGARAVRSAGLHDVPTFFSPYVAHVPAALSGLSLLAKALLGARRSAAIVNEPRDSSAFEDWAVSELLESPVGEVFFKTPRHEARNPLVVTGARKDGVRNAELFAQLAVLLAGEDQRVSFNWLGDIDAISRKRLNAAGVGVFEVDGDAALASRLAAGWIYLSPGASRGFPILMAEAMALGVPCVAARCERHQELIRDSETGYLCSSDREMIERIAELIDNPVQRERIGLAGREAVRARFGESLFSLKLLAAYAKP